MSDTPAEYPALSEDLRDRSLLGLLKIFGPGAIIASVTIGSGETIFASRGGAIFGYTLLWCFLVSAFFKGIQVYSGARFITLSGRHPMESWAELPGPRGWFVWFLAIMTVVWMPFWLGVGLPKMLGEFTNWVVGFPNPAVVGFPDPAYEKEYLFWGRLWATAYIVVAIALTWVQSYGFLEKAQTAIVGILLFCMVAAAVFSQPDLVALLTGLAIPRKPEYEPWVTQIREFKARGPWVEMATYLGVIGGGTQDYIGYVGMLREKAWGMLGSSTGPEGDAPRRIAETDENTARGLAWLRAPFVDVTLSFLCVLVFSMCFAVLGAAILYPKHEIPSGFSLLTLQAGYLVRPEQPPAVKVFLGFVYKTGIFFAFFGTIYGAYELYTRTMRECLVAALPRLKGLPLRPFRLGTLLWCGLGGLALLWFVPENDSVKLVTPAALVGSALTCGLWCFAMLWSDRVHVPRDLRMRWPLQAALVVAGLALTAISLIGIADYLQGLIPQGPKS